MSQLNVRVYYEDTNSGGVTYYANCLKFIERGRSEFLRELGSEQDQLMHYQAIIFAVESLSSEYLLPAKFNDLLTIHTEIEKLRRASLIFSQKIVVLKQNKILFKAQIIVTCLNAISFKPCAIPSATLEKING
ncbi:YbgC/FadM family acyl-CoA thioesterase [Candidatus Ruthia endofausta]|uniref:YbgC/FadM family acyl-CoA thioesterase n=1 Tax=Candidatus Ruthia endofausta TaxID=2738852 RepID=A0A6N0HPK2_9GAMM|nr:YbgC/FadM family acyl-CoA thioesterase [Candidatus Ruthia endofausta]QKQ24227.1 YbgC/FadM family acyl-CoA thioesterase [Candidatus Ruthia endofausta]